MEPWAHAAADSRIERIRRERVIYDAWKQTSNYRPNENATYPARLDSADTACDANHRRDNPGAATEAAANKDGSSPRRESKNIATELIAEAAGRPKELKRLISGVEFPIEVPE